VHRLETWIFEPAKHHKREKDQQRRKNKAPVAEAMFSFSEPKEKQRDRRNQTCRSRNWKTGESGLVVGSFVLYAHRIETGPSARTARQVTKRDSPAGAGNLL